MVTVTVVLKRHPLLDPNAVNSATSNEGNSNVLSDLRYSDGGQTACLDWNAHKECSNSELYSPAAAAASAAPAHVGERKTLEIQSTNFDNPDLKLSNSNKTVSCFQFLSNDKSI